MKRYTSDSTKLIFVGVGALAAFSMFGPIGIIVLGIVLLVVS